MAKAHLSGAGDVSLEGKTGRWIHGFGQCIHDLPNSTKILAVAIVEVYQP